MKSAKETTAEETKPAPEKANVAVRVLKPGTKIGRAICGKGRLSFLLTKTQAKDLEDLGKVEILGIE